jgi:hypothetical protein
MRRSNVESLPLQLVFHGSSLTLEYFLILSNFAVDKRSTDKDSKLV